MGKSNSRIISEYITNMKYSDFPSSVIDQAKRVTIHVLGASLSSQSIMQTDKTIKLVETKGGKPEATVWCSRGLKVPAKDAAFANGTISDIMDWEDCHWTGHPSAAAVPVALALCEKYRLTGKEYITSLVAAYEGYVRIAMAAQPSSEYILSGRNWGLVSWQIFAASLAAAKTKNFSAEQIEQVLGASLYNAMVAANKHAVGLAKSDIYHYQHGWCARNGIVSSELVELGFDNCYGALDGPNGFWKKVSDKEDKSWYTRGHGTEWFINETYLKHWPANMWVQTPLEALDSIMKEHYFTLEDVSKIRVSPFVPFICGDYSQTTKSMLDAQFSIPYCLTAYIMDSKMGAQWFSEKMRNDESLVNASKLFEYFGGTRTPNDNFDEFKTGSFPESTVEVILKDGTKFVKTMRYPKGHPKNNFTMMEQYNHFRICCNGIISNMQIERIIELVDSLDTLQDVNQLTELCVIK